MDQAPLSLVGAGNMGGAILRGLLACGYAVHKAAIRVDSTMVRRSAARCSVRGWIARSGRRTRRQQQHVRQA